MPGSFENFTVRLIDKRCFLKRNKRNDEKRGTVIPEHWYYMIFDKKWGEPQTISIVREASVKIMRGLDRQERSKTGEI